MFETYVKIDWLTLTKKPASGMWFDPINNQVEALSLAVQSLAEIGLQDGNIAPAGGFGFYPWVWDFDNGAVKVFIPRVPVEQGVMIQVHGAFNRADMTHRNILACALIYEWRVTRIDVAVDIFDCGLKPRWIFELYEKNHKFSKTRPGWFPGVKSGTCYIGSRHSARMLRIYDKGEEQKVSSDWLRVEGEYKDDLAHQIALEANANIGSVVHDMRNKLDLPMYALDLILEHVANGEHAKVKGHVKTRSDREKWFMAQVLPAFKTLVLHDYDAAARVVEAFSEMLDSLA